MKYLKLNKLLSGLLSVSMLMSLSMPAFAYNSTGSNSDLDNLIGEDTVQGYNTEYHDPISSGTSSAQTDVYVTRSSTFTVLVPKTIILSGSDGLGYYVVGAKGDVLPEDAIQIEPDSYELTLYKKDDASKTVNAVVTQNETSVTGSQVAAANGAYATLEGQIKADLKAGSWSAKMSFNIRLIEDGEVVEPEEPIEYQDFILTRDNRYKIGYTDDTTDLVIPAVFYDEEDGIWYKVIAIGEEAFEKCTNLKSVTIPDSVTSIGDWAFAECGLISVVIPDSVTSIGDGAFNTCDLISVEIPDSVTSIGSSAFSSCTSLESVTIPNSVTEIGAGAFNNCTSLTSVAIPNSVTSISMYTFANCTSLVSAVIPDSVTSIGNNAFENCTNLTITVPNSVTTIGSLAFYRVPKVIYSGSATTNSPWGALSVVPG